MRSSQEILSLMEKPLFSSENWEIQWENGLWLDQVFRIISNRFEPGQKISLIKQELELLCFDCDELNIILSSETKPDHRSIHSTYLVKGSLYTLDISFKRNGLWIDGAKTFQVGPLSLEKQTLWSEAFESTLWFTEQIKAGEDFKEICERFKSKKLSLSLHLEESMGGHGIGTELHQGEDFIYSDPSSYIFKKGDIFTVEPVFWKKIMNQRVYLYFEVTLFILEECKFMMPFSALSVN